MLAHAAKSEARTIQKNRITVKVATPNYLLYDWLFRPVVYWEVCGGLVFLCWMTVRGRMRVAFQSDSGSGEAEAAWGNSAEKSLNPCIGCLGRFFWLFHPKASVFYPRLWLFYRNVWLIHRKASVFDPKFWVICPKPSPFHRRLWLADRKASLFCRRVWLFSPTTGVGAPGGWVRRAKGWAAWVRAACGGSGLSSGRSSPGRRCCRGRRVRRAGCRWRGWRGGCRARRGGA